MFTLRLSCRLLQLRALCAGLLLRRLSRACMSFLCAAALSGCGLAGTAGGAAVGASLEVQQAQQAKQTEARVQQQIQDAQQQAAAQRDQAEKDAQ